MYSDVVPAPDSVITPELVIGEPATVNAEGATKPTLVTVPLPDDDQLAVVPSDVNTCPTVPIANSSLTFAALPLQILPYVRDTTGSSSDQTTLSSAVDLNILLAVPATAPAESTTLLKSDVACTISPNVPKSTLSLRMAFLFTFKLPDIVIVSSAAF